MSPRDDHDAHAAISAHTTRMARWCSEKADDVAVLRLVLETRPLSPQEHGDVLALLEELLRKKSQEQSFFAALGFYSSAPWWAWFVVWWTQLRRRWRRNKTTRT